MFNVGQMCESDGFLVWLIVVCTIVTGKRYNLFCVLCYLLMLPEDQPSYKLALDEVYSTNFSSVHKGLSL